MPKENKDKRILKTEPRLNIELNDEQRKLPEAIYSHDVVIVEGTYGSGKSLAAIATALKCYRKKEFNYITLTRPFIADKLGALPGGIDDKLFLEINPLIENINKCQATSTTDKMFKDGAIKIQYNGKVKGNTFSSTICVCDETQDLTYPEFVEILTRLGKDSKIIFTISKEQIHPKIGKESCYHTVKKLKDSGIVGWVELTKNHRNPIITEITKYLDNNAR